MYEQLIITGDLPLAGEIEIRGSKNASSKLMIASLLTEEPCMIENIPFSSEIDITRELCERVGSKVEFLADHTARIVTPEITTSTVAELSRKNRVPILAFGPLLHRKGVAEVPVLGGDPIGHRPVNFHIEALTKMGVRIELRGSSYYAEADEIHGNDIELPYPSVGATENVLLTAVRAHGTTIIINAAVEPEIINLIEMLNAMGGAIALDTEARTIHIEGVSYLHGVRVRAIPDRNEIVSFVIATLATDGRIFIKGINKAGLESFLTVLKTIGARVDIQRDGIEFSGKKPYHTVAIETAPHPSFMTDWQQPFCVLLTQAQGESTLHETVYEDRLGYTKDLKRMGADIDISDECPEDRPCRFQGATFNHHLRIRGQTPLRGTDITMTDIRAGMAHLIAALAAKGESHILGVEHLDRGYEKIDERLRFLGADIKRISA